MPFLGNAYGPADYISIIILQQFIIAINLMNCSLYIALFLLISHQTKNMKYFAILVILCKLAQVKYLKLLNWGAHSGLPFRPTSA